MFPGKGNNMQDIPFRKLLLSLNIILFFFFFFFFFDVSVLICGDLVHFFPLNLVFHCLSILHFISLISFGWTTELFPVFCCLQTVL